MSELTINPPAAYAPCQHRSPHRPHFEWASLESFLNEAQALPDGLHTVQLPHGPHLDILLQGMPLDPAHGSVSVFFNGAVTNRATKSAPFLSGSNAAKKVDVPLISITDPSLLLSGTLGLAWYMGSAGANAQRPIHSVLRHIAETSGNHLVMVGGSGGGFAALQQAQALGERASAFVWNPQTDALKYVPRSVKEYLSTAFPDLAGHLDGDEWRSVARRRLEQDGIESDLPSAFGGGFRMKRLLLLQNWNDWHTKTHMVPLLRHMDGLRELWPGVTGPDDEHVVWLTETGNGHAPPPVQVVQNLLGGLVHRDASVLSLVKWADAEQLFPREHHLQYVRDLRSFASILKSKIQFSFLAGHKVHPAGHGLPKEFGGIRFRYHLMKGQEVHEEKFGSLSSTYVVPVDATWDHILVSVLDGFDRTLFTVRFLNPGS